jgi:hypothetical protein
MIGWEKIEPVMGKLAHDPIVKKTLREKFGKEADIILAKLTLGQPLGEQHNDVLELMQDLVGNDGRYYTRYTASESYGPYEINILGLGGVYWYQAPDYGWSDELFESLEDAESAVEGNWCDTLIRSRTKHYRPAFGTIRKRTDKELSPSKMQPIELDASTMGGTWNISLRPTRRSGFTVWFAIGPSPSWPKKIWTSSNKLTWRTAADVLIGMEEDGLQGDWFNSVQIAGVDTWQAEMLKMCAMTMENPYYDQLQALLEKTDAEIAAVYRQFGSLVVPSAIEHCTGG